MRPRQPQQFGGGLGGGAELARQIVDRVAPGQRQPHQEPQARRRADQPDRDRLLPNLGQLVAAVEGEVGDPIAVKRLADRRPRLDRVHEMDRRRRAEFADERHLGERGAVEMPDAAGSERAQHARLGVAFDGVEDIARERVDKAPRRGGDCRRAQAQQRLGRPQPRDGGIDRGQNGARRGAIGDEADLRHRTILRSGETTPTPGASGRCGVTDQGWESTGASRPGASADRARTSLRVPDHSRFP